MILDFFLTELQKEKQEMKDYEFNFLKNTYKLI